MVVAFTLHVPSVLCVLSTLFTVILLLGHCSSSGIVRTGGDNPVQDHSWSQADYQRYMVETTAGLCIRSLVRFRSTFCTNLWPVKHWCSLYPMSTAFVLQQGCQRSVEEWQNILRVRSLVLTPHEDLEAWVDFSSICRKSGKMVSECDVLLLCNVLWIIQTMLWQACTIFQNSLG